MRRKVHMVFNAATLLKGKLAMQTTAAYLRDLGITPSPQRMAIYKFLKNNAIHPTVDTIYHGVLKELPAISRTTVYNTVKKLAEVGAIQEVIIEDGELRYDADMSDHGHFKCQACGNVFDLFPPANTPLVNHIHGLPEGFVVKQLHLCCRGLCADCAE